MNAPLTLVRLNPDLEALARWALPLGYLPRGSDPGYALHAALKAALGDLAPKPFVLRGSDRDRASEVLGYCASRPDAIREASSLPGIHDVRAGAALRIGEIEAKAMPASWSTGRRLAFEVRARPIVRTRVDARTGRSDEMDVAVWKSRRTEPGKMDSKSEVYQAWLRGNLAARDAARLVACDLAAIRRTRVVRRARADIATGKRHARTIEGPDILFRGLLEIGDPDAFAALMAHGVGRHRAFGFGCMLLAPPGVF